MRRAWCAVALLTLAACAPANSPAFVEQQWHLCQTSALPMQKIGACSVVIAAPSAAPEQRAAALVERGKQRGQLGQDARAMADFGRALRIDRGLIEAYVERGLVHHNRGAYQSAILDFQYALALQPSSELAAIRLDAAERAMAQAPLTELDQITQALAADPYNAALWNSRCWIRAVSGEALDLALADCNEALRLAPNDAAARDSRGLVQLKRGDLAAALADYEAAVALDPTSAHYLYGRGIVRLRMGQERAGRADMALAERFQPGIRLQYATYGVAL